MSLKSKLVVISVSTVVMTASSFANSTQKSTYETWGMYQGNAQHTGYVPIQINSKEIRKKWEVEVGEKPSSPGLNYSIHQASIGNKYIFVARNNYVYSNTLQAFSLEDGHIVWEKDLGRYAVQPTAFDRGVVFVQTVNNSSDETKLRAYNSETGSELYSQIFSAQWQNYQAPVIDDGYIYACQGYSSGLAKYNELNGNVVWRSQLGTLSEGSTAALNNNYLVYYNAGKLYSINRSDGTIDSQVTDPNFSWHGYNDPVPRISDKKYAYVTQNNHLTKYNLESNEIEYTVEGVTSDSTIDNKFVYIIQNGWLTALDKNTGDVQWSTDYKSYSYQAPNIVVTKNLVFVSDSKGTVAYSKKGNHNPMWEDKEGGSVSLSKKGIFIVTHKGTLIAYSMDS